MSSASNSKYQMPRSKQYKVVTLLATGLLILLLYGIGSTSFSTSVVDLLPGNDPEIRILRELINDSQGRQLTVRLYSNTNDVSKESIGLFIGTLSDSDSIRHVWRTGQQGLQETGSMLYNDRYLWLLPNWVSRHFPSILNGDNPDTGLVADKIIQELDAYLQSPDGMILLDIVPKDPFLLMNGLEERLPVAQTSTSKNEIFLWVEQEHSPFAEEGQQQVFDALTHSLESAQKIQPDLEMEFTGVSVFASASKSGIKSEIQRLNLYGIILVLLITLLAVRSIEAMARIATVVFMALLAAAATVVCVFDSVHVIALVIGSILTGIAVDYGFHLILTEENCLPEKSTRKAVIAGSLSSALGFLVLMGAPLPFLRQVGVFVGAGLIAALLIANILRPGSSTKFPVRSWKFRPHSLPVWLGPLLLLLTLPGLLQLRWDSNIRDLEYPLPHLKEKDSRLQGTSSPLEEKYTYLIHANDILTARSLLEDIDPDGTHVHAGLLLPDYETIRITHEFFSKLHTFKRELSERLEEKDYYAEAFEPFFVDWEKYKNLNVSKSLYIERLSAFSATLPGPLKNLVHQGEGSSWFMILTDEKMDITSSPNIIFLDQANMLSSAFGQYGKVMWIFAGACLLVLFISVGLYFGIRSGMPALMVPTIAMLIAFGMIGYFHGNVGLFHLVGALLAFCISLDYGLFAVTSYKAGKKLPKSISISSITTIAVFGILATSQIPAVQQLATTILLILASTLLVILLRWPFQKPGIAASFELIPHGQVARMVENILHVDGTHIRAICNPHIYQSVPSECLIEAMAQCAALLLAENNSTGVPRKGMLVVVQSSKMPVKLVNLDQRVTASVELRSEAKDGLVQFSGRCTDQDGSLLSEAQFSIFIPPVDFQPEQ